MTSLKSQRVLIKQSVIILTIVSFLSGTISPQALAQNLLNLPAPGTMVLPTAQFNPPVLRGMKIYADNPLRFDFILDAANTGLEGEELKLESEKLIRYFMAALTVPQEDLWVNLSPYESDRIIPEKFGFTEMGRDLLAEDYLLKQLTASLMYPEDELGKSFWTKIYQKAYEKFGTTEIPVNTFNKVWILPDKAVVYEDKDKVFIGESRLKVMLEEDYLALNKNRGDRAKGLAEVQDDDGKKTSELSAQVVREVILPEIEKEVNEGRNFSKLRQIYQSLILATWFKQNLKETFLGRVYANQNKVEGVDLEDKTVKEKIYEQYVESYKKGVYDYIKEDYDQYSQEVLPRKYFSGGVSFDEFGSKVGAALERRRLRGTNFLQDLGYKVVPFLIALMLSIAGVGETQSLEPSPTISSEGQRQPSPNLLSNPEIDSLRQEIVRGNRDALSKLTKEINLGNEYAQTSLNEATEALFSKLKQKGDSVELTLRLLRTAIVYIQGDFLIKLDSNVFLDILREQWNISGWEILNILNTDFKNKSAEENILLLEKEYQQRLEQGWDPVAFEGMMVINRQFLQSWDAKGLLAKVEKGDFGENEINVIFNLDALGNKSVNDFLSGWSKTLLSRIQSEWDPQVWKAIEYLGERQPEIKQFLKTWDAEILTHKISQQWDPQVWSAIKHLVYLYKNMQVLNFIKNLWNIRSLQEHVNSLYDFEALREISSLAIVNENIEAKKFMQTWNPQIIFDHILATGDFDALEYLVHELKGNPDAKRILETWDGQSVLKRLQQKWNPEDFISFTRTYNNNLITQAFKDWDPGDLLLRFQENPFDQSLWNQISKLSRVYNNSAVKEFLRNFDVQNLIDKLKQGWDENLVDELVEIANEGNLKVVEQLPDILLDLLNRDSQDGYKIANTFVKMLPLMSQNPRRSILFDQFKTNYQKMLKSKSYSIELKQDKEVWDIVNRSLDIMGTKTYNQWKQDIKNEHGRNPQMILWYLCIPEIVSDFVKAYRQTKPLNQDFSLFEMMAFAFAEGFNLYGDKVIYGQPTTFAVHTPIGLDRFGEVESELKTKGYLRSDYTGFDRTGGTYTNEAGDSFPYGTFKDAAASLEALYALMLYHKDMFLNGLANLKYPDRKNLTRSQLLVGTYLFYCAKNPMPYLKKYGDSLVGSFEKEEHGKDPMWNAQWPAATDALLRRIFSKQRGKNLLFGLSDEALLDLRGPGDAGDTPDSRPNDIQLALNPGDFHTDPFSITGDIFVSLAEMIMNSKGQYNPLIVDFINQHSLTMSLDSQTKIQALNYLQSHPQGISNLSYFAAKDLGLKKTWIDQYQGKGNFAEYVAREKKMMGGRSSGNEKIPPIPMGMGGRGFQQRLLDKTLERLNELLAGEKLSLVGSEYDNEREVLLWGLLTNNKKIESQVIDILGRLDIQSITELKRMAAQWIPEDKMTERLKNVLIRIKSIGQNSHLEAAGRANNHGPADGSMMIGGGIFEKSGLVHGYEEEALRKLDWINNPEKKLNNISFNGVEKFVDNVDPDLEIYEINTSHGVFLIHVAQGNIQTVAIRYRVRNPDQSANIYIDLSDQTFYEKLVGEIKKTLSSYDLKYARRISGRMYAPIFVEKGFRENLQNQFQRDIFLNHLLEKTRITDLNLSCVGVYYFQRNDLGVFNGAAAAKFMPQIFSTISLSLQGQIRNDLLAHEIVHTIFTFLYNLSFREIQDWLREAHSDLLDDYIGKKYERTLPSLSIEGVERLKIDEGMATVYQAFITPIFNEKEETIISGASYLLLAKDVDALIKFGLIPEMFAPSKFGYQPGQRIDATYYSKILTTLSQMGLIEEAKNIIHSISGRVKASIEERFAGLIAPDKAKKGGIDFNPATMNLETRGAGMDIPQVNLEELENMQIDGFVPVIFNISPINNLQMFLGLSGDEKGTPAESADSKDPQKISYHNSPAIKEAEYELVKVNE